MKVGLVEGNRAEVHIDVTEDMCPAFDGVVVHHVYSTWSMAHHMELAARKVLMPYLEEHEEGLGTHLSIDHLSPTPVGKKVRVEAVVCKVDGRGIVCDVRAFDGDRLVGQGKQVQRVLPKQRIRTLIERYR